jgi:uncharacterized protein DUF4214
MPTDAEKLEALREIAGKEVVELVKVSWPAPDGEVYYVSTLDPYLFRDIPIDGGLLELRLPGRTFQDILNDATIGDDRVPLKLWDADGAISDLAATHGSGQRVEIFYWFPQVELLLSQWFGHLQPMEDGGQEWYECTAEGGFMSSMLPLPRRAFFNSCQAVFGGLLDTQEEIDESDCPYNRHLTAGSSANPTYQNNANGTVGSNGAFTKTSGGNAWNCGASHTQDVNAGEDAMFEFTVGSGYAAAGFTTTASPVSGNADFAFGLQWNPDGSVTIKHSGTLLWANAARWTVGDIFRVEKRNGVFRAFKGSAEIRPNGFSAPAPADPLYLGIAIQNEGAGISAGHVAIGDIGASVAVGNLDPATSQPFTDCPRNREACVARLGDDLNYLGFDTVISSYVVGQTKGPNITVTTRGNESNLKRPLRVIAGQRHVSDLDLLAYTVEPDTKHPEGGAVSVLFAISEGPNKSQANQSVNGVVIGAMHLNARNGEPRQARTGFSPQVSNYSSTALFFGRAQGDFTKTSADQLRGEVDVEGLRDVRRYTDETTFVEEYSQTRAWWLLHSLRNRRWGHGLDVARFVIQDWIDLAEWDAESTSFTDVDGTLYVSRRTSFNAELIDRSTQQQINDICLAGRYGLPFRDQGKLRIVPLSRVSVFSAGPFTDHAFMGALVRMPTPSEREDWVEALEAAQLTSTAALFAEGQDRITALFESAEYTARARTDVEFVDDCYLACLNRAAEPEGEAFWVAEIAAHDRAHVLNAISGSPEALERVTDDEFPLFTDEGSARNICVDANQRSTLTRQILSDAEVPNRLVVTFDDSAHGNAERPLVFEDELQQLRAGRAFGDTTRRVVEKTNSLLGVTDLGEAVRGGNLLLHLGPFDEGGTVNYLRIKFTAWFSDCLTLRKYQVIKVLSSQLERYKEPTVTPSGAAILSSAKSFVYFRIRSMRRLPDLKVEISAQAYPVDYYDKLESVTQPPPIIGTGGELNPAGDRRTPPGPVPIDDGEITIDPDRVRFRLMEAVT